MLMFLARRTVTMLLTALCLTFIVFFLTNLPPNLEKLAKQQASVRMTDSQVTSWLNTHGYGEPLLTRYGEWLGVLPGWTGKTPEGNPTGRCYSNHSGDASVPHFCGLLQGDWGYSTVFKQGVGSILSLRLGLTGWLMLCVLCVMIPV